MSSGIQIKQTADFLGIEASRPTQQLDKSALSSLGKDTVCKADAPSRLAGDVSLDSAKSTQAPLLAEPEVASSPDALSALAKAFCKVYATKSSTLIIETSQLSMFQDVNSTMSECALEQAHHVMEEGEKLIAARVHYNELAERAAARQKLFSDIFSLGTGWEPLGTIILTVFAVAAAIPSGGASAELAVAEVVAEEGGALVADAALAEASAGLGELGAESLASQGGKLAETAAQDAVESAVTDVGSGLGKVGGDSIATQGAKIAETAAAQDAAISSSTETLETATSWSKGILKFVGCTALSTAFALPELSKADSLTGMFSDGEGTAGAKDKIAVIEKEMGPVQELQTRARFAMRYFQSMTQREGDLIPMLTKGLSEVMELAGKTFTAYRNITSGLAHAV